MKFQNGTLFSQLRRANPVHFSALTPFELAPPARAVIGDNGLKEVQQGALVDGFAPPGLESPAQSGSRVPG